MKSIAYAIVAAAGFACCEFGAGPFAVWTGLVGFMAWTALCFRDEK